MDKLGRILEHLLNTHPEYVIGFIVALLGLVSLYALREICSIRPIAYALQKLHLVEVEEVDEVFEQK